jgi:hypothetical protein
MAASLDDLLTAQKNGVVAINTLGQATLRGLGAVTSSTVTATTLVIAGGGYLVNVSVVVAGSTSGLISNFASTTSVPASSALMATPTTVGVYRAGQVFTTGLVITPGTGQSINVTYSLG